MGTKTTKLQLVTRDTNSKSTAQTIGYVNPDASDVSLKTFAQGLIGMSSKTLDTIYKTTQEDITDAGEGSGGDSGTDTDTSDAGFSVASSSPLFSSNSDTYTAALNNIGGTGNLMISFMNNSDFDGEVAIPMATIKKTKNINGLIDLINHYLYSTTDAQQMATVTGISNGFKFDNFVGAPSSDPVALVFIKEENENSDAADWLQSVGENLIQVAGNSSEIQQIGDAYCITLMKE